MREIPQVCMRSVGDFEYAPSPLDDKTSNGAKMTQIAKAVLAEYNKKENKNFLLMRIDKADRDDRLCAGYLYHMSIRVKDRDSEKIIEKMVWKGSSLQVEERSEVTERPNKTARSVSRPRIKKMASLVRDAETRFPDEAKIKSKGVIVEEEFLESIPKGEEGYIDYTRNKLYFGREQEQRFLCYSILHKKWLYTLDDSITSSIRQTLNMPKEDQLEKPTREGKRKISEPLCCGLSNIPREDLQNPMVLSFAWFFIEDYNYKKGAQLELLEVSQASILMCAGMLGEISIKAIDQGVIKLFDVTMYSVPWLKSVEIECPQVEELSHDAEMEHCKKRRV